MLESKLKSGEKMFVVSVKHFVKLSDFAKALTNKHYNNGMNFPKTLTKKDAEKILKDSLFFYGLQGEYPPCHFESSYDEGLRYNEIYENAIEWVVSKYPYLNQKSNEH